MLRGLDAPVGKYRYACCDVAGGKVGGGGVCCFFEFAGVRIAFGPVVGYFPFSFLLLFEGSAVPGGGHGMVVAASA